MKFGDTYDDVVLCYVTFQIPFGDKSVASKQIMVARAGEARTSLRAFIIINTIRPQSEEISQSDW